MNDRYPELAPPRHRGMNDDDRDDFVAIDFETMTPYKTSACAIGMVRVIDGEIVQRFYSIINPVRDKYTDKEPNYSIHGISLETAEKAPTFKELFPLLKNFIGNLPIVCHNKGADIPCIERLMDYYGLNGIDTTNVVCTYAETFKSLSQCCEEYSIPLPTHHDALCDAEACAKVYLCLIGKPIVQKVSGEFERKGSIPPGKEVKKEHRVQADLNAVKRKDTIFYGAKVVITGVFEHYPDRDELAAALQELGAKVNGSLSRKTTHLVLGKEGGPKKIEKYRELRDEGYKIRVVKEVELINILKG